VFSRTCSLNSSFSFVVIVSDFAMMGTMLWLGGWGRVRVEWGILSHSVAPAA
jgi:hypothetical protein